MTRKSPSQFKNGPTIVCEGCSKTSPRTGPVQRYCQECSEKKSRERSTLWARGRKHKSNHVWRKSQVAARGLELSATQKRSLLTPASRPDLWWEVRIAVPFTWAASKNYVYSPMQTDGHIELRRHQNAFRKNIVNRIKGAMVPSNRIIKNKVWLAIFIQKPNHRGDAINLIHSICDSVKEAIGVDDRWFSIRSLDWEIQKNNPQIFICVGQEATHDAQACSSCGRILRLEMFQRHAGLKNGRSRNCKECCSARVKEKIGRSPAPFFKPA